MMRKIVTLCGSTRFKKEYEEANYRETLSGHIVLSVGCFSNSGEWDITELQKKDLDLLHLDKILMSDEIFVVNPGGYIGESTKSEIVFAIFNKKGIRWLDPDAGEKFLEDNSHELGRILAQHVMKGPS